MSKERLERIVHKAERTALLTNPPKPLVTVPDEDFEWLKEQAELVQELELENKALNFLLGEHIIDCEQMEKKIERYREALELIADKRDVNFGNNYTNKVYNHSRNIARKALEGESE